MIDPIRLANETMYFQLFASRSTRIPRKYYFAVIVMLLYVSMWKQGFQSGWEQSLCSSHYMLKSYFRTARVSAWNGMLVIFVSSNDIRPRWKFQAEVVALSLFSLLFTQLLTSSTNTLFRTIEIASFLILNIFAFLVWTTYSRFSFHTIKN